MTKDQFNSLDFKEVIQKLDKECDQITTIDCLKDFIKENIDNDNYYLALHVLEAITNDISDSEYWDYDYSLGTLDTPTPINSKEDVEHLIYD